MEETIAIPRSEYEDFMRYKHMKEAKDKFNFDEVFGIGSGKLNAQEIKNMLREEW